MQTMNEFHIAFDIAALVISITVLIYTFLQKRTDKKQNRVFIAIVLVVTLNSIVSALASFSEPFAYEGASINVVIKLCQYLYFIMHTLLSPLLYFYVISVTGTVLKRGKRKTFFYALPFLITEVLALINPQTQWVYYYDEAMAFHRSWAEYLIYAVAALYFILALEELLFAWNAITKSKSIALIYLFALALAGVIIQLINQDIKSELFAEALALMGAMLSIENEDDRIDADTGIYNRRALQMDVHSLLMLGLNIPIIFVKITNANIIERVTQSANHDILSDICSDFFITIFPRYRIYHPNPETFVILCNGLGGDDITEKTEEIRRRFKKGWNISGISFMLEAAVIETGAPKMIKNEDDVLYVADSIIPMAVSKNRADIEWIMRRAEVENAVKRSIMEDNIEVYYQPTYDASTMQLHGAEALARMKDSDIGMVSPDEFIPVAEQNGMVEEIDDFVLREVCRFIESGENRGSRINVNLSVIQCLRPGFFEHIMEIVDSYDIKHSQINFEITESVEAEDYEKLSGVVKRLKNEGFSLYMDDYGTGYSNMEAIFSLDFDVIKIDKSILWSAEKDGCGRTILENSIRMIHDLGRKVLVEGVETEEQVDMLKALGVDYLQGYLFACPLPKEKFLKHISGVEV